MSVFILYLLKVTSIHGLLYLFYWLFLRRTQRHHLNRAYLLIALIGAFSIPIMEVPKAESIPIVSENDGVLIWLTQPAIDYEVVMSPIEGKSSSWSLWLLIPVIYMLVVLLMFIRSAIALFSIHQLKKQSEAIKKYWFNLFKTSHSRPFSFFSNVFIPKSLFDSEDFDQVLAHECVHVKQRHSVDRLLLDFVVSLFWFNPFMYLYRNALIEIHEYQADEAVVKRFKDPIRYQEILFSQLQSPQYSGMVSHFNVSTIKKRIVMMNKQNKKSKWVYAFVVPFILMMIFAFSSKEALSPIEEIGSEMIMKVEPRLNFEFPEISFQKDYKPSILPLKNTNDVRMTSAYGMRTHPIYKVKKMHEGTDFSCKIGSEVIATADGVVDEIIDSSEGYGKIISIKHGDMYQTRYAQLSEFKVEKGDNIVKGQVIGLSGNSGASTAPHLHYEVIEIGKEKVDPELFIKNYQFQVKATKSPDTRTGAESSKNIDDKQTNQLELESAELDVVVIDSNQTQLERDLHKKEGEVSEILDVGQGQDIMETSAQQTTIESTETDVLSSSSDATRLLKAKEFLAKYEGDGFREGNWKIIIKEDRVKLKKKASLTSLTLFNEAFE